MNRWATYYDIANKNQTAVNKSFAREVEEGLRQSPKTLPTRFIYDDRGSSLFEKIMELPEYYLTRCEHAILETHSSTFSRALDSTSFNLVELGAGNGKKTKVLLSHFSRHHFDFHYFPIDISEKAVAGLEARLKQEFPALPFEGLVMDYFEGLRWLEQHRHRRNFVLFLGSNIGNLKPEKCHRFLGSLHQNLNEGDLVAIGFDLVKDYRVIEAAYNDRAGVTREFTLNLLHRINHELGGQFDLANFDHFNHYNPHIQANEAFIVSRKQQAVPVTALGHTFQFEAWEPVHTEFSFKYTLPQINRLATGNGFQVLENLQDSRGSFCEALWQVKK